MVETRMDTPSFPVAAEELLPHAAPMCCIDRLLASTRTSALADVVLSPGHSLLEGDFLTPAGYVELAAQTAGVMQGFDRRQRNLPPQFGYLVGAQDFVIHEVARVGDRIEMTVRIEAALGEVTVLAAEVRRGDATLATGRLKVYVPE